MPKKLLQQDLYRIEIFNLLYDEKSINQVIMQQSQE